MGAIGAVDGCLGDGSSLGNGSGAALRASATGGTAAMELTGALDFENDCTAACVEGAEGAVCAEGAVVRGACVEGAGGAEGAVI